MKNLIQKFADFFKYRCPYCGKINSGCTPGNSTGYTITLPNCVNMKPRESLLDQIISK